MMLRGLAPPVAVKPYLVSCWSTQPAAPRLRSARRVCAAAGDDERADQMKAVQEAMANPAVASQVQAMQEQMQKPEVQQQMADMQAVMSNPNFMQKMAELREDPELKPLFEEIRAGGMGAMLKAMNDPSFLAKLSAKMGDMEELIGGAADPPTTAAGAAAARPEPVVNNVLDAARYGDLEALEDYIAIKKADMTDPSGRTALHYAVAYDSAEAAAMLLEAGADVNAADSTGNTALHFAAGYGRRSAVRALLNVGADVGVKNSEGQRPVDVVRAEPRNPLNADAEVLAVLDGSAPVQSLSA